MKKIFTLAIISLAIFSTSANAQTKPGIRVGVTQSTWSGDAINSLNNLTGFTNGYVTTKSRTGFYAGGFVNMPLTDRISLEPGAYYSQKGYTLKGELPVDKLEFLGASATAAVQSHYIDIPVLLKMNVAKGFDVYAGPQVSYLVKNNLHMEAGALGFSALNKDLDITNNFNRVDWAVTAGAGYTFDNGFSINAGYDLGLSRLDKNSNFKSYNRAIKLGIGFRF
jgi:hypothetical protein